VTAYYANGTVYVDAETGEVSYKPGVMDQAHGTAYGYYNNTLNETGWAVLEIQTARGRVAINNQLMFAAGYLEGVLTARSTLDIMINSLQGTTARVQVSTETMTCSYLRSTVIRN